MMVDIRVLPRAMPALTGIRGIAACLVVLYHANQLLSPLLPHGDVLDVFGSGFRGVDLFFILSGFVLMHVHQDDFVQLRGAVLARFALLRFWRVYPLNAAVALLILLWLLACPPYLQDHMAQYTPLGFVQTVTLSTRWVLLKESGSWNGPSWSLSFEVVAYAAFPMIAWWMARERSALRSALYVAAMLGGVAAFQYATGHATDNPVYRSALIRALLTFTAGVCLYRLARTWIPVWPTVLGWLCVAAIGLFAVFLHLGLLMPFAFAGLILLCGDVTLPTSRFLANPVCMYLGKLSFGIYLVHYVVIDIVVWLLETNRLSPQLGWQVLVVAYGLVWLLARLLHHLVEMPSQAFGRRLAGWWTPKPRESLVR